MDNCTIQSDDGNEALKDENKINIQDVNTFNAHYFNFVNHWSYSQLNNKKLSNYDATYCFNIQDSKSDIQYI